MHVFHNRPMAFACVVFAVLTLICLELPWGVKLALAGLFLIAFAVLLLRRIRCYAALLATLLAALSMLSSIFLFSLPYENMQAHVGKQISVEGVVVERVSSTPYSSILRLRLLTLEGKESRRTVILETEYATSVQLGEHIGVTAEARAFEKERDYDEEIYLLSKGDMLVLTSHTSDELTVMGQVVGDPLIDLLRLNEALSYRLYTSVGGEAGGLAAALLLGNRSFLSKETSLAFRRVGISHLLALSGLHVSILVAAMDLLLRLVSLPKKIRFTLVPLASLGYLALTGFAPSTLRAVVMVCTLYLTFYLGVRYDSFTVLTQTLACILLVTPHAAWDLSMWMSFLAAISIVIFSPTFDKFYFAIRWHKRIPNSIYRVIHAVGAAFFVGMVANLALLLLTSCVYGSVSLLSVPATLLLSPVISFLLPLSALSFVGGIFASLTSFVGDLMLSFAAWASKPDGILLSVSDPFSLFVLLLITLLLIFAAVAEIKERKHVRRLVLAFPCLLLLLVLTSRVYTYLNDADPQLWAMRTYTGESVLITRRSDAMIVDMSSGSEADVGAMVLLAEEAGVSEIDELIMTRYYSRSPFLVAALGSELTLRTLRLPPPQNTDEEAIAMRIAEEAERLSVEVRFDTEELGMDDARLLAYLHTPFGGESSRVLLSLEIGEETMTFLNGAILSGEHAEVAKNLLAESDAVLLSGRAAGKATITFGSKTRHLLLGADLYAAPLILPEGAAALHLDEKPLVLSFAESD